MFGDQTQAVDLEGHRAAAGGQAHRQRRKPLQPREPIGEGDVLAEEHAVDLVVAVDNLALGGNQNGGIEPLDPVGGVVDRVDAQQHRHVQLLGHGDQALPALLGVVGQVRLKLLLRASPLRRRRGRWRRS